MTSRERSLLRDPFGSALEREPLAEIDRLLHAVPPHELSATLSRSDAALRSLAGLGRELWRELDVPAYLEELRRDWDARGTPGHLP
ncbi:MAG: hypothetical protein JNM84_25235 [Planctomycetes bacterium]|nr:hypothetical protein [Planctomycetota bacterium]